MIKPFLLNNGDILFREDDYLEEIYFLGEGAVYETAKNGVVFLKFLDGQIIGIGTLGEINYR